MCRQDTQRLIVAITQGQIMALQVRYDLLRQQLQMRHFVKHGIEHQVLCPGLGKFAEPIDTLGTTTPDRYTRRHVGIFVSYPEPFA